MCKLSDMHFPGLLQFTLRTPASLISRGTLSEVRARMLMSPCLSVRLLFCERNIVVIRKNIFMYLTLYASQYELLDIFL